MVESAKTGYVLAIDQGTTSSRVLLIDHDLKVLDQEQRGHEQISLHPGWVEHDPTQIFDNVLSCMQAVLERNADKVKDVDGKTNVRGIGITNQRETTVAWNKKTGDPLHNAIVWMDKRTAECVKEIEGALSKEGLDQFMKNCGLPVNTYFSGSKMWWLLRNVDSVKKLAEEDPKGEQLCFSTIDTWLIAVSLVYFVLQKKSSFLLPLIV